MVHQITSTNFNLTSANKELISEKLAKIEKHLKDVGEDLKEIRVVVGKGSRFGFRVKIEVFIPSHSFVARSGGFSFEGTVDDVIEEVVTQINKHKGKAYRRNSALIRKLKHSLFFSKLSEEI